MAKSSSKLKKFITTKDPEYYNLTQISLKETFKLCDFTGLPAHYTCIRTSLRYYDIGVYEYMNNIDAEEVEQYYEKNHSM